MGIQAKLISGISLILAAAISVVVILTSIGVVRNNDRLVSSTLNELDTYRTQSQTSAQENFDHIAENLEHADVTTHKILQELYSSSYATLAQAITNQIYPMIESFDFDSANNAVMNLLSTTQAVKWVQYTTSETPVEADIYQFGQKISEQQSHMFRHRIQGEFAYLELDMQVSLAEMEAFSQQVTDIFSSINAGNQEIMSRMDANGEQLTVKAKQNAVSVAGQSRKKLLRQIAVLMVSLWIVACFTLTFIIRKWIIRPVLQAVDFAEKLSEGNLNLEMRAASKDEIGDLHKSLSKVVNSFQNITETSKAIARGNLQHEVTPRSEQDTLGYALQDMSVYLNQTACMAAAVAEGDLKQTIRLRSTEDSFGHTIQSMTEGLRALIVQIRASAEQISLTGTNISSLADTDVSLVKDVHDSIEQVTSSLTEMGSNVEDVAQNVDTLSSSTEETSASVSQMASSIAHIVAKTTNLTRQSHQMSESLEAAVQSLERIVKSTDSSQQLARETIQDALEGQQVVKHVINSMATIQQTITAAVDAMTQFSQRSQDIGSILDVIQDISEQTSLLALNASIIAAQAGAHGRGFAVVADEMKVVADGVGSSAKDIATIVTALHQDTDRAVKTVHEGAVEVERGIERTQQARETLDKIIASAERSAAVVTEFAETLHGLMATNRNISTAIEQIAMMTDDITAATREHQLSTGQTEQAIAHINDMTSQIQMASTQQLRGIHQVLEATTIVNALIDRNLESSQQITHATGQLSSQADILLQSVDRFKLNAQTPRSIES